MVRKSIIIGAAVLAVGVIVYSASGGNLLSLAFRPTTSSVPSASEDVAVAQVPVSSPAVSTVLNQLSIPWDIAFLPDGSFLVTERTGSIRRVMPESDRSVRITIPDIQAKGEGGLLGIAVHPQFLQNGFIYLYETSGSENDLHNRIVRYRFDKDQLKDPVVLVDGIPAAVYHDGGELVFGPDGFLYATAGDANNSDNAQNQSALAGKVLRMTDEGKPAPGNPFGTLVYSFGHRNPQGLAWDASGNLWATEHGRSGLTTGFDEINKILPGKNYGWPMIQGSAQHEGMETPVIQSGPTETWAPSGIAVVGDRLFFAGLRGEALYEISINNGTLDSSTLKAHFRQKYGRLRAVVLGPDGALYLTTSNTDGRGTPKDGDDRVLRVDLKNMK